MDKLIDSVDRNFQRLLRWVYPGALLLLLSIMTDGSKVNAVNLIKQYSGEQRWILAVGLIAAGAVAYLLQVSVVNQVVSWFSVCIRWEVNAFKTNTPVMRPFNKCTPMFDKWAAATKKRWYTNDKLHSYLDYAWATHHATSITGWLTLIFIHFVSNSSPPVLAQILAWLFVGGALVQYAHLARVRLESSYDYLD